MSNWSNGSLLSRMMYWRPHGDQAAGTNDKKWDKEFRGNYCWNDIICKKCRLHRQDGYCEYNPFVANTNLYTPEQQEMLDFLRNNYNDWIVQVKDLLPLIEKNT